MDPAGWIKLHRTLISDDSTFQLLTSVQQIIAVHIILRANIQTKLWHDYKSGVKLEVKRGQLVCSRAKILSWFLQNEDGEVSDKKIRTALAKFHAIDFITCEATKRYTLLTVVNYDVYQNEGGQDPYGPNVSSFFEKKGQGYGQAEALVDKGFQEEVGQGYGQTRAKGRATTKEILYLSHDKYKHAGAVAPAVLPVEKKQKTEKPKKTYHPEAHTVTRKFHALIGLQGVNTQRFFADLNTADNLLKAYRMTGTELENAIVWLLGDRFVGPAIGRMKAIEDHFTLWLNRNDPNVKQRQKNAQTNTAKPSSALFGNQIVPAEHRKGGIIEL